MKTKEQTEIQPQKSTNGLKTKEGKVEDTKNFDKKRDGEFWNNKYVEQRKKVSKCV